MKKLLILIASTWAITSVDADSLSGAYINLNTGVATQQFSSSAGIPATINAGYRFNPYLAVEGGYSFIYSNQYGANFYNNIADVAVKGTLPLSSIFALYGRLGGGANMFSWNGTLNECAATWYCANKNSTNFVAMGSVGASFKLSKHFDLRVEDTLFVPIGGGNLQTGQINLVLGGVQFNF